VSKGRKSVEKKGVWSPYILAVLIRKNKKVRNVKGGERNRRPVGQTPPASNRFPVLGGGKIQQGKSKKKKKRSTSRGEKNKGFWRRSSSLTGSFKRLLQIKIVLAGNETDAVGERANRKCLLAFTPRS